MKHTAKRFAALLAALVLALCLSIPAFAAAPLVRDEMGLFDADTYSQLEASAEAASDGHDCDVYFLVVDSICRIVLGGDFSDIVTRWHPMGR